MCQLHSVSVWIFWIQTAHGTTMPACCREDIHTPTCFTLSLLNLPGLGAHWCAETEKGDSPILGGFNELSSLRATVNHHSLPPSWFSTFQLCLHFLSSLFSSLLLTIHPSNIKARELGFITRGIRQAFPQSGPLPHLQGDHKHFSLVSLGLSCPRSRFNPTCKPSTIFVKMSSSLLHKSSLFPKSRSSATSPKSLP